MKLFSSFRQRFYNDFLRPDRTADLQRLIADVLESGYTILPLRTFAGSADASCPRSNAPVLLLRTDVDSDLRTARAIWTCLKRLNVQSSFYFRLSTVDTSLMRDMEHSGDEVGYHYEELATLGKRTGCGNRDALPTLVPQARFDLQRNLDQLRQRTNLPLKTAAVHGDWLNRRLGVSNSVLLDDRDFRKQIGIDLEAYDLSAHAQDAKYIDKSLPEAWSPADPIDSIAQKTPVVYLTIHPRQWGTDVLVNIKENAVRLVEELSYRWKTLFRIC